MLLKIVYVGAGLLCVQAFFKDGFAELFELISRGSAAGDEPRAALAYGNWSTR